jgi:membrane-associated phospholipid phosphatase
MSIDAKRRYAAAGFLTLLVLSVFWPSPVVSINQLWIEEDIDVDALSFLGREAPSWDVVFWCVAGLFLIVILQTSEPDANPREPIDQWRAKRFSWRLGRRASIGVAAGALATAVVWLFFDMRMLAWAEGIQAPWTQDLVRLLNRLGGGWNPVMIVAFFIVAGICYRERRWVAYGLGMSVAGLFAGTAAQVIKHLVGRARPELWLGPTHYAPGASTSFPSGHTVGAFALAGVLFFGSRSMALRALAILLAAGVGFSRVLAFRHWASDVTASAAVGLIAASVAVAVFVDQVEEARERELAADTATRD